MDGSAGERQLYSRQIDSQVPTWCSSLSFLTFAPDLPSFHWGRVLGGSRIWRQGKHDLRKGFLSRVYWRKKKKACCSSCFIQRMRKLSCTVAGGTQVRFGRTSLLAKRIIKHRNRRGIEKERQLSLEMVIINYIVKCLWDGMDNRAFSSPQGLYWIAWF